MKRFTKATILFLLLASLSAGLKAQDGLSISSIFEKYGKEKGVTMVELSKGIRGSTQITYYKSLAFKEVIPYLPEILKCIENDKKGRKLKQMQEVIEDGKLLSGYYQVTDKSSKGNERINRYVLFKKGKKNKATLVYIEGEITADDLLTTLYAPNTNLL